MANRALQRTLDPSACPLPRPCGRLKRRELPGNRVVDQSCRQIGGCELMLADQAFRILASEVVAVERQRPENRVRRFPVGRSRRRRQKGCISITPLGVVGMFFPRPKGGCKGFIHTGAPSF